MKTMKRMLVWCLTIAMLLTTCPVPSLAGITSETYTGAGQNQTPLQIVEEKIASNRVDGNFVGYTSTAVSAASVATGTPYSYTLRYHLRIAPTYVPQGDSESKPCYTTYQNVRLTIGTPTNVELLAVTNSTAQGTLTKVDATHYAYVVPSVSAQETKNVELTLSARMTDNGSAPNGSAYAALTLGMTADVTVAETGESRTFEAPAPTSNPTALINTADEAWGVKKSVITVAPIDEATVQATYRVEFGLKNGAAVRTMQSDYDKPGVLSFSDYLLTDTLPSFVNQHGQTVLPTAFSIALLDAQGQPIAAKTVHGDPAQSLSVSTSYYNTLQTQGNAGGSTVNGQPTSITLPAYSRYLVTATYPRADFKLPYERSADQYDLTNTADVSLTLCGGLTLTDSADAPAHYEEKTQPAHITASETLRVNGVDHPYDAIYAAIFQPAPIVQIYLPEQFDQQTGAPKTDPATGLAYAPVDTLTITDVSATSKDLKPGTYIAWQSQRPADTQRIVPAEHDWQQVSVAEGATETIGFINQFVNSGLLRIKKVDENGRSMAGVTFTLTPKNAADGLPTYTCQTGNDGAAHVMAKPGSYILSEAAPTGYVAMDDRDVTIESGKTVDWYSDPITNARNVASLTLNAYAVTFASVSGYTETQRTPIAQITDTDVTQFIYLLEWSTDSTFGTEVHSQQLHLAAHQSALTLTDLPRTTPDGKSYYTYRLSQQSVGAEEQYALSAEIASWSYRADTAYTTSFHNVLSSRLTWKKVAIELNVSTHATTQRADGGKAFDLYRKDGDAYTWLETVTTNAEGIATTNNAYTIALDADNAAQYYLVEKDPGDYLPTYAYEEAISVGEPAAQVKAWGPIELDTAKLTDRATDALTVKNTLKQGQLQIIKTQNVPAATRLAGAAFSVKDIGTGEYFQHSDVTPFVTGEDGTVLVTGLLLGHSYAVKEETAPAGYRLSVPDEQTVTVSQPAQLLESTFANNKYPMFFVSKRVKSIVSGGNVALKSANRFVFELYRKNGNTMELVSSQPLTVQATNETATVSTSAPVMLTDEAGAYEYYLLETAITDPTGTRDRSAYYIDGSIYPGGAVGQMIGGKFYYGPFTLQDNAETRAEALNILNDGRIVLSTLNKRDGKTAVSGATYAISVATADEKIIARLVEKGFALTEGRYVLTVALGSATSKSIDGLPVFDTAGAALSYTVTQTGAKEGYLLPDAADLSQTAVLAEKTSFKTTLTFKDAPILSLTALKLYYKQWERDTGHPLNYSLPGATLGLYLVDAQGNLTWPGAAGTPVTAVSDSEGHAPFAGLDGTKTYFVAELVKPDGYVLESGKSLPDDYTDLIGQPLATATSLYVGQSFNMGTVSIAASNHTATVAEALLNVLPYVRFRLTKLSDDPQNPVTLSGAKYQLRSCTTEVFAQYSGDIAAITAAKKYTADSYTYETGSALKPDGTAAESGVFFTGAARYGLVYWLAEISAPAGYTVNPNVVGPFAPEGVSGATAYALNETVAATHTDTLDPGPGGSGVRCYFRVELNKELYNVRTNEKIKNLPNVTFTLYLADDDYQPKVELTHFTTGLDKQAADYAAVAGRGVSETLEFSRLYSDKSGLYAPYITRTGSGTEDDPYQYVAKLVLEETTYPADSTPVQLSYPLEITSVGAGKSGGERLVVDKTYVGSPIRNVQDNLVPVRFRKVGYEVETPAAATGLEGVTIAIYTDEACQHEEARVDTAERGYASVLLTPRTTYYYREIRTCAHYEIDEPEKARSFTTGGYGAKEQTITLSDPRLRVLTVTKKDASGAVQSGASFTVTLPDGGAIVDGNGEALPDTFVTNDQGQFTLELPYGTYTLRENAAGATSLTDVEKRNFLLVNPQLPFTFDEHLNTLSVEVSNPGAGRLEITKQNDAGAAMNGVAFDVSFKAFATLVEINTATETQNTGFGLLPGAQAATVWTTADVAGDAGRIVQGGLVPGWYRLVERPAAGHVDPGEAARTHIYKVTARGIGQADDAAITDTIVNVRRGYLHIAKSFVGDLLLDTPATVTFSVYRDAAHTDLADTLTVSIDPTLRSGEGTLELDPGDYYVLEQAGDWYGNYTLNGVDGGLVDGHIAVHIASENTLAQPVALQVVNKPALATVTGRKTDDDTPRQPLQGVQFALYYLDGQTRLYYHAATRTWTGDVAERTLAQTDAQGAFAFEKILLPLSRMADETDNEYFVEEVYAPAEYAMAAPVSISLTRESNICAIPDDIVNVTGLYIDLTQYGRKHDLAETADTLPGAGYTLYIVDGQSATAVTTLSTDVSGQLCFGNLEKLKDGKQYAIAQTTMPQKHVDGSTDVWLSGTQLSPTTITCEGAKVDVYLLTANKVLTGGALKVYNTPKGSLMVLKYNYLYPTDALQVPDGAQFAIFRAGETTPLRSDLYVSTYMPSYPDALPGGYAKDAASGLYLADSDPMAGAYLTSAYAELLEPGEYVVKEIAQAVGFYETPDSTPADKWHTVQNVTIDDDGGVSVSVFANIPQPQSPRLDISKAVTAINGVSGATGKVPSLQNGWQTVTYTISGFTSDQGTSIQLPLRWLKVEDIQLSFMDAQNLATMADHRVQSLVVGAARYTATALHPVPFTDAIYAAVYGLNYDAAGKVEATYLTTLDVSEDVSETGRKVAFAGSYEGFRVLYGVQPGSQTLAGLHEGFSADPIRVNMIFRQDEHEAIDPVARIINTADVELMYNIGQGDHASGSTPAEVEVGVEQDDMLPHVRIEKTAVRTAGGASADVNYALPGDIFTYTITITNLDYGAEAVAFAEPVLMDLLPEQLSFDAAKVTVGALPAGMTAEPAVSNGQWLYVRFHGSLPKGESVTITVPTVVKTAATSATGDFTNQAYVISTRMAHKNQNNPYGVSFANEYGVLPTLTVDGAIVGGNEATYRALTAATRHELVKNTDLKIYKTVSADLSGSDVFVGNEGYALVSPGGEITYKLTVSNGLTSAVQTHLRIMDKLPTVGDTRVGDLSTRRNSAWTVALQSVSAPNGCTVYVTDRAETASGGTTTYWQALTGDDRSGWTTGGYDTAKAVLLDFGDMKLEAGQSVTVTLRCKAPEKSVIESGNLHFTMANNDIAVAAAPEGGLVSVLDSPQAKVCVMPAQVSLGNRVWIDKNGNGIQDVAQGEDIDDPAGRFTVEPSLTQSDSLRMTLRTYLNSDSSYSTTSAALQNGFYTFSGLNTARIITGETQAYDARGNIYNNKLFGARKYSYQLAVTGVPAGYLVTGAYARNGGSVAPTVDSDAAGQKRRDDSNFHLENGAYVSEKFYLPVGAGDVTFDLGLLRVRDLKLTKLGTDGRLVDGATFTVYGPFTKDEIDAGAVLTAEKRFDTITTVDGVATLSSALAHYMNHYDYYVVVENVESGSPYEPFELVAQGAGVAAASAYAPVTGAAVSRNNYFFLVAKDDNDTSATDEVTVTNTYKATGSLTVSGTKTLNGIAPPADWFRFVMSSADDAAHPRAEAVAQADGSFAFPAMTYAYAEDSGNTYHYTITEVNGGVSGITYDARQYTLTVSIHDMGGGRLRVDKALSCSDGQPCAAIAFANAGVGKLRIEKQLSGNAADAQRDFRFTLALRQPDGTPMTGTVAATGRVSSLTLDAQGKASFQLKGGESVELPSLPTGATYTVSEADERASGYATTWTGASGTISTLAEPNSAIATNARSAGALTVRKVLHGNLYAPDDTFAFTLTLAAPAGSGLSVDRVYPSTGAQSAITVQGGQASFTLSAGESLTVLDIPVGVSYTVTEAPKTHYVASMVYSDAAHVITAAMKAQPAVVTATNITYGMLEINKTITGNAREADRAFEMALSFTRADSLTADGDYRCTLTSASRTAQGTLRVTGGTALVRYDGETGGFHALALKGGETLTISGLVTGMSYTVTEADMTAQGYITDPVSRTCSGQIATPDAVYRVAFTNHRAWGALSLVKLVAGNASGRVTDYDFTIELSHAALPTARSYPCVGTGSLSGLTSLPFTVDATKGKSVATVTLQAGDTLEIQQIYAGAEYTITESSYAAEGYATVSAQATGSIDEGVTRQAAFTNTRYAGSLKVSKTLLGNYTEADRRFPILVQLTGEGLVNVNRAYPLLGDATDENGSALSTVTFAGGQATLWLQGGKSFEIMDIPTGTGYAVSESAPDGYTADVTYPDDAHRVTQSQSAVTVRNSRFQYAPLSLTKQTTGNAAAFRQSFEFTLTLSRTDGLAVDGDYTCTYERNGQSVGGNVTVTGGQAKLSLLAGQTVTLQSVLTGTSYAFTETDYTDEGYHSTVTQGEGQGQVAAGGTAVAFTNERYAGTLTVSKQLHGNATEATRDFRITVTFTAPSANAALKLARTFPCTGAYTGLTFTHTNGLEYACAFTLKGGQSVTIGDIPEGVRFAVQEDDYTAEQYATDTVIAPQNALIERDTQGGATAATADITNTRNSFGSLIVQKTVSGAAADTTRAFDFTLTLGERPDVLPLDGDYAAVRTSATGAETPETITISSRMARFALAHGESLRIDGILTGTVATVEEADASAEGYACQPANRKRSASISSIAAENVLAFVNERVSGTVHISKAVAGNAADASKTFDFTVLLSNTAGVPVDGTYACTRTTATGTKRETLTVSGGQARVSLLPGETLDMEKVLKNTAVIVREDSYVAQGYAATPGEATGTITTEGQVIRADFVNTRNVGVLQVINRLQGNGTDAAMSFHYTLHLSRQDGAVIAGEYPYTLDDGASGVLTVDAAGNAAFDLIGARTLTLPGILAGTAYQLTQNGYGALGYTTVSQGAQGVMPLEGAEASFTNSRYVGELALQKVLSGNATEPERAFNFTISATTPGGAPLAGTFAVTGDAAARTITFTQGQATIALRGGQTATLHGLLRGVRYTVTETEANTESYVTTAVGDTGVIAAIESRAVFTNARSLAQEYKTVTVTKAWNDAENKDGLRPDAVTVYLYNERGVIGGQQLSEANGWSCQFENLPVYQLSGQPYTYRVAETAVEGYFGAVQQNADSYALTNTHTPDPFTPIVIDNPPRELETLIEYNVPLSGTTNMNEGDCFD